MDEISSQNWTPPEYWDDGIAGALLDYNVYAGQYEPHDGDSTQNMSSYGTLGFNLGAWRFRSDYQYSEDFINGKSSGSEATLSRTYLFRPIPAISSKFTAGQYDLDSDILIPFTLQALRWKATNICYRQICKVMPPNYRYCTDQRQSDR